MTDYSKDIYDILLRSPEGLSIRKIVRHVFNTHNSLFDTIDIGEVKRDVTAYLIRKSKTKSSPIERTDARGVYRLNPQCNIAQQLMLDFQEEEEVIEDNNMPPDAKESIPDLFAGMY